MRVRERERKGKVRNRERESERKEFIYKYINIIKEKGTHSLKRR